MVNVLGTAEVGGVKRAVFFDEFGEAQGDDIAGLLSTRFHVDEADHVLAHVEVPFVAFLEQADGFQFLHHGDVGVRLGGELTFGGFYEFGLEPLTVVIA